MPKLAVGRGRIGPAMSLGLKETRISTRITYLINCRSNVSGRGRLGEASGLAEIPCLVFHLAHRQNLI